MSHKSAVQERPIHNAPADQRALAPLAEVGRSSALAWWSAATILVSAFLLFQVQPVITKKILPWFGGSPAVWTTAMLFFQTALFCGYAYAHVSEHYLSRTVQMVVHVALIVAARSRRRTAF